MYAAVVFDMNGVIEVLAHAKQHNVPIGLATSSRRKYLNFILDGLKIREYFTSILSAEDVVQSKPDPEVYLRSAEQLGVEASQCVAFEDSLSGVRSAQGAGMFVVGIATTHQAEELSSADQVITSFAQFDLRTLG
jgi:HAD superfamily hydrolase (TIGR01509 family)